METLAYLHHSTAYENPEDYSVTFDWKQANPVKDASLGRLAGGFLHLLALTSGLGVMLTTNQAWAVLRYGDSDVDTLQRDLIQLGYLSSSLDTGRFLQLTDQAVRSVQRDCGVAVDGVVGAQTQACIDRKTADVGVPSTGGGVLKLGSKGSEVVLLQQNLIRLGYLGANLDTGYFGTQTQQAVITLQRDCGILADGAVGSETRACLGQLPGRPRPVAVTRPAPRPPSNTVVVSPQPVQENEVVVLSDGTVIEVSVY